MDFVYTSVMAGLIATAIQLGTFLAVAVVVTAIVYPLREWWRWRKRHLFKQ